MLLRPKSPLIEPSPNCIVLVESFTVAQDLADVSGASVERLAAAEGVPVPTFVMRKFRW